jgi:hypothetical protein
MITELTDLEPLLGQYDAETVLVGPLLNLSINSSFRFFYIAGNGAPIYESIALGFCEAETDAESQRAEIIAKLKSRFGEVKILGSQLEMAREAHTLWPKEETARFLATAALEANLQPMSAAGQDEADERDVGGPPSDHGQYPDGVAARDSITHADAIDAGLTDGPTSARDQAQPVTSLHHAETPGPLKLPDANPSGPLNCEPAVTPPPRHLALDNFALAVFGLKSSTGTGANSNAETAATAEPVANTETVAKLPVKHAGSLGSIMYRLCVLGGVAALGSGLIILTSTRHIPHETRPASVAAQSTTADGNNDASQTTSAATIPVPPNPITKIDEAARLPEPAPITVPPSAPSPAADGARTDARAGAISRPQSPPLPAPNVQATVTPEPSPSQAAEAPREGSPAATQTPVTQANITATRLNPDEISDLISRGSNFLKSGDFAAARIFFRRAAESGSADAAVMLGKTFDPLFLHEVGAIGIQADIAQCRQWYEKAAELGSEVAAQRLAKLTQAGL